MSLQFACALADLSDDLPVSVAFDDVDVAIVAHDGEYFAIQDECSHANVPLSEGDVEGCTIECYLHGSRFDLRTGEAINLPATESVPVYRCVVQDDGVYVDLDQPLTTQES